MISFLEEQQPIPILTKIIAVSLFVLFVLEFFLPLLFYGSFCPRSILFNFEYWRILSSPFLHANTFHLLMNTVAWLYLGRFFEDDLGIGVFVSLLIFLLFLCGLAQIFLTFTLSPVIGGCLLNDGPCPCSVGFSSILFALLTRFSFNTQTPFLLFGFWVPSRAFPFIILAISHALTPRASLTGHLAGILIGLLYHFSDSMWHSLFKSIINFLRKVPKKLGSCFGCEWLQMNEEQKFIGPGRSLKPSKPDVVVDLPDSLSLKEVQSDSPVNPQN